MTSEKEYECINCGQIMVHTRAVPDVPELERVNFEVSKHGLLIEEFCKSDGKYVLHTQAAEIIAAKDAEIEEQKRLTKRAEDFLYEVSRKLGNADAKLAQYEAQEIVGYVTDRVKTRDGSHCLMSLNKAYPYINAVYTSPAPAADLKAENEKLHNLIIELLRNEPDIGWPEYMQGAVEGYVKNFKPTWEKQP